jgi:predicted nucleic acid-binding protein
MIMRKTYILDSFAWVEYVLGSSMGAFVDLLLRTPDVDLLTPSIVIAELAFKFQHEGNSKWDLLRKFIKIKSKSIDLTSDLAEKSGTQKLLLRKISNGIGLTDAIIYQTSLEFAGKLVTGDSHFEEVSNVIFLGRKADRDKEQEILTR